MAEAIAFNQRFLSDIPESAAVIELIRTELGITGAPAVVDEDFVRAVVSWQAAHALVQDGKLGPASARPLFLQIGLAGAGRCEDTGLSYSVPGPINIAAGGAVRTTTFNLLANFRSDVATGVFPSCCEVRQDIQWDAAFSASFAAAGGGTVPHGGFPAGHPAGDFLEDRNADNTLRYGHRTGFSAGSAGNQYLDTRRRNQAFGHRFVGTDNPTINGGPAVRGSWTFRLRVIDVCNANRLVDSSRLLVVNWL